MSVFSPAYLRRFQRMLKTSHHVAREYRKALRAARRRDHAPYGPNIRRVVGLYQRWLARDRDARARRRMAA